MGSFMKADRKLDSIYELDPVFLKARGIKGIIFDIDNTLEEYAAKEPGERSVALIRRLGAAGFRIGILSNASHKRAESFLNGFPKTDYPEILMVSKAGKPAEKRLSQAGRGNGDPSAGGRHGRGPAVYGYLGRKSLRLLYDTGKPHQQKY